MSKTAGPQRDEKRGTWLFIVELPPGPEGQRRQAKRRGFATKKAAQDALDKLRVGARDGTMVEPTSVTVGTYLKGWQESLAVVGRKPATISNYGWVLRTYVLPRLGGMRLQALQPGHLDKMYAEMLASGLSARTVRLTHTVVRKALADAQRKGLVVRNVADLADPPSSKSAAAPEMAFWTPAELRQFLEATTADEHGALYRFAAMTGTRRGEVCALQWADVDLEVGGVRIRRQLGVIDGRLVFSENPKSDAGRRTIRLDPVTVTTLRQHRTRQAERRLAVGSGWGEGGLVFCGAAGEPLHPDTVSKGFTRRARVVAVPAIRFHDLRHTHCAHLIAAGRNPREISRRLGHASVAFTLDRYGHLMPEADADAAAAVALLVDQLGG